MTSKREGNPARNGKNNNKQQGGKPTPPDQLCFLCVKVPELSGKHKPHNCPLIPDVRAVLQVAELPRSVSEKAAVLCEALGVVRLCQLCGETGHQAPDCSRGRGSVGASESSELAIPRGLGTHSASEFEEDLEGQQVLSHVSLRLIDVDKRVVYANRLFMISLLIRLVIWLFHDYSGYLAWLGYYEFNTLASMSGLCGFLCLCISAFVLCGGCGLVNPTSVRSLLCIYSWMTARRGVLF